DELSSLMGEMTAVNAQMEAASAWELETNAKIILTQLGIDDVEAKVGDLSGGYRKRIALATALLSFPDLLLMDEPTNHLDAASVEWLQDYLNGFGGALLLITHDRYFLDQVTNRIIEVDRGDLYEYDGNYSYYLEKKALSESVATAGERKHARSLVRELEWLSRGPKARSTKQKARIDRIGEMQDKTFKSVQSSVEIDTPGRRIGKKVIELEAVTKAYGDRTIIKDFTYQFGPDSRVGIIGRNGAGKSTLMNIITGRTEPDSGTVDIGGTIHIGYFDQHSEDVVDADPNQRVINYLKEVGSYVQTADGSQISASQMLERFLFFGNQQYTPLRKLSGGERRRLFLLKVLMEAPNVLILDEPTNDLDVQTLSVLEEYLEEFNGCVIVVSHDRYFLDRTVNVIFTLDEGQVRQYPGNYSVYMDYRRQEEEARKEAQAGAAKQSQSRPDKFTEQPTEATQEQAGRVKPLSNYEQREYRKLEEAIAQLETKKLALEQQLYQNSSNFTALEDITQQLTQMTAEIDQATERWMELAERDV
ncbi:MAG: ABC-F family ATP-binding cassette domain-containing protein, partial [Elainellaceae cyanobacterium]